MNQPYGGQYGQPQYGAQPPAGAQFGVPAPAGYPQQQPGYPAPPPQPGYPPQQPGYPQQQPQQGGFGRIVLESSYFFMAWRLNKVPMMVYVDGAPQPMQWGQTFLDLPAGQHQLGIVGQYRNRMIGQTQTMVNVVPGQQQVLYYRAPAWISQPGSVGPQPNQPTNGLALSLAVSFIPLLFAIIMLIVTLATT